MVKMDKVKSYEKTDTDVIFKYKTDGKKYTVTVPFYIDGVENPAIKEYLDYIEADKYKYNKAVKILGRIQLCISGVLLGIALYGDYKLMTDDTFSQVHQEFADDIFGCSAIGIMGAAWGLERIENSDEKIKEYEKKKSRK